MKSFGWHTIFLSVIFLSLNKLKSAQDIIIDDELADLIVEQLTIEGEEFVLRTAPEDKAQFYRLTD